VGVVSGVVRVTTLLFHLGRGRGYDGQQCPDRDDTFDSYVFVFAFVDSTRQGHHTTKGRGGRSSTEHGTRWFK